MDLSLIILNYQSMHMVREQLRVLAGCSFPFSTEIIVVDNASGDHQGEGLRRGFPQARFLMLARNQGMGGGNNRGLEAAHGTYALILNPDIVVFPEAIEHLYGYMHAHPRAGMCGPKLLNPDGTLQESCFRFPRWITPLSRRTKFAMLPWGRRELDRFLMRDWDHAAARPVDWLLGGALMVRREAFEKVGMFDERFFLFFEETDWCRRFWQHGWEVVYVPEAVMVHYPHRLSSGKGMSVLFSRMAWIHIASWAKYFCKWRGVKKSRNQEIKKSNVVSLFF